MAENLELEHAVRSAIARGLNDLITMEAEDLVNNTVALTHDVMKTLEAWDKPEPAVGSLESGLVTFPATWLGANATDQQKFAVEACRTALRNEPPKIDVPPTTCRGGCEHDGPHGFCHAHAEAGPQPGIPCDCPSVPF